MINCLYMLLHVDGYIFIGLFDRYNNNKRSIDTLVYFGVKEKMKIREI